MAEVDQIYITACPASPVHYQYNPVKQKESCWGHVNCIGPRSCYDEGKRVAE